jgi:nitrite reductase/ring-hydroxylating ferredoxin subunit
MAELVAVAKLTDLDAGLCRAVQAGDKAIALFNVSGTIYALDNVCLHRGGPLGEGFLEDKVITCPWHMWEYDVCTGERLGNPGVKVCAYPVQIDGDQIKVAV